MFPHWKKCAVNALWCMYEKKCAFARVWVCVFLSTVLPHIECWPFWDRPLKDVRVLLHPKFRPIWAPLPVTSLTFLNVNKMNPKPQNLNPKSTNHKLISNVRKNGRNSHVRDQETKLAKLAPTAGQSASLFAPLRISLPPSLCASISMILDIVEGQK